MGNITDNTAPATAHPRLIEMGVFSVPHGVRGQVKLRSFAEIPENIAAYGPLQDAKGKHYILTITGQAGDLLIASVQGVETRTQAEALKNTTLYIPRSALPALKKGQYYQEDLRDLQLFTQEGETFGRIASVHNFGAGTLVNVTLVGGGEEFFPFNPTVFPVVDLAANRAVIAPPERLVADKNHE